MDNAQRNQNIIYICSDSVGETADAVVQATIRQFSASQVVIKRIGHIQNENEITFHMEQAAKTGGMVVYTLVQPELREMMKEEAIRLGIRAVDILGPMMQAFMETFHDFPSQKVGLLHQMDEAYFRRIEAIEFAVKFDDGRDARGLFQAQVVIVGISRTSKTPLSIFLAHKGIKVANFPIVPEVKLPEELFKLNNKRIVGLTMDADHILKIRTERLKSMGLPYNSRYATLQRVVEELEYGANLMKQLGCRIINVTDKAIEETAGIIMHEM